MSIVKAEIVGVGGRTPKNMEAAAKIAGSNLDKLPTATPGQLQRLEAAFAAKDRGSHTH